MSEVPAANPEAATWSILGAGNVGGELINMLAKPEVAARHGLETQPQYVGRSDGWHKGGVNGKVVGSDNPTYHAHYSLIEMPGSDVLFIATPSLADYGGEPMRSLMDQQLELGKTVVTAEKGVLADRYAEYTGRPGRLGYWATVGGGTKLIQKLGLDTRDPENIKELHLATNATLTYIYSEVSSGANLDEVVDAAAKLGYAEPGATGAYDVIHNEAAGDVPRKIAIILKSLFPEFAELDLGKMDTELTEEQVMQSLNEADRYRYLVSMYPEGGKQVAASRGEDRMGGFEFTHEGWLVVGGLQRVDRTNPLAYFKALNRADAGYYIELGPQDRSTIDGKNFVLGSGAGGAVTANTMLDNYDYLRNQA